MWRAYSVGSCLDIRWRESTRDNGSCYMLLLQASATSLQAADDAFGDFQLPGGRNVEDGGMH